MKLRSLIVIVAAQAAVVGCLDKDELAKGELVDEAPPGSPLPGPQPGKSDDGSLRFALAVESAHPYANDLDQVFPIALAGRVPSCAHRARLHFATLRTEARYDFVHVEGPGGQRQSFDGVHDDTWTRWFELDAALALAVRLDTDYSITRDGFRIDAVEVEATVFCPAVVVRTCEPGELDVNPSRGVCECPRDATCVTDGDVRLEHVIGGGFTGQMDGHRAVGTHAYKVVYTPAGGESAWPIGTIDRARLQAVVRGVADLGLLARPDVSEPTNWNETLAVTIGATTRTFTRAAGSFPPADADLLERLDALFACGDGGALTCSAGFACNEATGQCEEDGCVCPALYNPVCGADGRTYSNACAAGCARVTVRHPGECGIAGDPCGGLAGDACQVDFKCRYGQSQFTAPYPDASGTCVAETYCDAPGDCGALVRPAVPGSWACEANACAWNPDVTWQDLGGFAFATPHPYRNLMSEWRQVYLPAGATRMRLVPAPRFELEAGYDFLEVHSWQGGRWVRVKRYTGTVGPTLADEFVGQYHYLRLATDSSVVRHGFELTVQYLH